MADVSLDTLAGEARTLIERHAELSDTNHPDHDNADSWNRFRDECVVFIFADLAALVARAERAETALGEIAQERYGEMPDGSTPRDFARAVLAGDTTLTEPGVLTRSPSDPRSIGPGEDGPEGNEGRPSGSASAASQENS